MDGVCVSKRESRAQSRVFSQRKKKLKMWPTDAQAAALASALTTAPDMASVAGLAGRAVLGGVDGLAAVECVSLFFFALHSPACVAMRGLEHA